MLGGHHPSKSPRSPHDVDLLLERTEEPEPMRRQARPPPHPSDPLQAFTTDVGMGPHEKERKRGVGSGEGDSRHGGAAAAPRESIQNQYVYPIGAGTDIGTAPPTSFPRCIDARPDAGLGASGDGMGSPSDYSPKILAARLWSCFGRVQDP